MYKDIWTCSGDKRKAHGLINLLSTKSKKTKQSKTYKYNQTLQLQNMKLTKTIIDLLSLERDYI